MVVRRALKLSWWFAAALIVMLAVTLSAARLLLPGMSEYRVQIQSLAERLIQRPVEIGSLDAAWHGLSPVLQLNEVVVKDPHLPGGRIAVREVQVALDVVGSVLAGKWQTAGLRLIGTELQLHTDLREDEQKVNLQAVFDWLLKQESIALEDVSLRWRDPGLFEVPLRFSGLSARLVNQGRRHQLLVESELPLALGRSVMLAADLRDGERLEQWTGTVYLKTEDLQLSVFAPALADTGLLARGAASAQLWMGLDQARLNWGTGSVDWHKPGVHNASADAQGISADRLGGKFHWRKWRQAWRIGVEDFRMLRGQRAVWPSSRFDLELAGGEETRIQGEASTLVLDELSTLLPLLPWVEDDALAMLDRLQPRGLMRAAEFEFRRRGDLAPQVSLRARVEKLSLAANGGLPGARGLSGYIEGNLQAGLLSVDSRGAELVMPTLFAGPLPVDRLGGDLRWQRYEDLFRVDAPQLHMQSGALAVDSRLRLDWSYDQASPWLDLQLAADSLPLTAVPDFLPTGVMSDKAVNWLQNAFKAGRANDIRLVLQGRLDQLPFDDGQGRFEARFGFADTVLRYDPHWGKLDALRGQAVFSGRSMRITGDSAFLMDSPVQRVVAQVKDLQTPMLTIDGTVGGTLAAMLQYIPTSPLNKDFGPLVEQLQASGDAQLQLKLAIPLKRSLGLTRINGDVHLAGNDLQSGRDAVALRDIRGVVHFTRDSISVKRASARLLEQPVEVNVYREGDADRSATVVDIQGRLALVEMIKRSSQALAPYLDGGADWHALLRIGNQSTPGAQRVELELKSDLQGVASRLPAPLAKDAGQSRALSIRWAPGSERANPWRVRFADSVAASVLTGADRKGIRRATVHFGAAAGALRLPPRNEVFVTGQLPVIELDRWLALLRAGEPGRGTPVHPRLDLKTDDLRFAGFSARDVQVRSQSADPWNFTVTGSAAAGTVRWVPSAAALPARLQLDLDRLHVTRPEEPVQSAPGVSQLSADELPELQIEIADLRLGARDLGAVTVVSRRVNGGTRFDRLLMNAEAISLTGQGSWLGKGERETSRFSATVNEGSLEKLTALFGSADEVNGGRLKGALRLSWRGSPIDFSLASLEGDLELEAKDGRLTGVDEGPGKLLSLFSLNSLQRRLTLDFRDVVKEGFSFDTMKGDFVVMNGDAFTEDFTIEGTSVSIEIAGRTGLVARDYNQLVTVTPQVTSTLPIAGAIAGGPAVGAAVFLADKLVGERFNRLTQIQYEVTGSWEAPKYTRLKKRDTRAAPEDTDPQDN